MKYVQNKADKNFILINREKPIPPCFQESQRRAILRAASTEEANCARDNGISLVNAQRNPSAAVCVWENNVKGANFFAFNKMVYQLVARCSEASAKKNHS